MLIKPIKIKGKKYVKVGERDFIILTNAEYIRARYRTQDLKRLIKQERKKKKR